MNNEMTSPRTTIELIVVLFLIIISVIFYHNWNESKKELATIIKAQEVEKTVDGVNKPMEEVTQREKDIYPKINAEITQINKNIKTISESVKRLEKNQITKEQSYDTFKDKNIYEVSQFLRDNGINNSVIGR